MTTIISLIPGNPSNVIFISFVTLNIRQSTSNVKLNDKYEFVAPSSTLLLKIGVNFKRIHTTKGLGIYVSLHQKRFLKAYLILHDSYVIMNIWLINL